MAAPGTAQDTEAIARSYFAAVSARDPDAMGALWDPDGVDDLVPIGVFRGPQEIRELFGQLFRALPDAETIVDRVTADERGAVVQWRMSGTFSGGPFMGVEPTGRRVDLRGADCIEVEGGRIVRNTAYYDGMDFARGVGLLPERDSGVERAMFAAFNALTKVRDRLAAR